MHEVKAIIRPERLDAVLHALHEMADLPGVTVSEVRGIGRRLDAQEGERQYGDTPMAKVEIVVPDTLLDPVLRAIEAAARTGRPGDGKLFVYAVARTRRIRTGEAGEAVL